MQQQDALQKFIFEDTDIRGEIVRLNQSFQTIMLQHHYPKAVFNVLAENLMASVLLSSTMKFSGQFTVQFQSDGPVSMLVAKCTHELNIRGLAQFDPDRVNQQKDQYLLSGGQLVVTVESDDKVKPYQSLIPLVKHSMAANIEDYFGKSVQIPTKLWFAVNESSAVGFLLQLLPGEQQTAQQREQFWEQAVKLGETITAEELHTLDNETILYRLYHQEKVRLFEPKAINFFCPCSKQRMERVIATVGREEVEDILKEKQVVEINCEYCNQSYSFDRIDVADILHRY